MLPEERGRLLPLRGWNGHGHLQIYPQYRSHSGSHGSFKGNPISIIWTFTTALVGIFALAAGMDGWMFKRAKSYERVILILSGLALVYPTLLFDFIGLGLLGVAILLQKILRKND